jgi:hypothetical protein
MAAAAGTTERGARFTEATTRIVGPPVLLGLAAHTAIAQGASLSVSSQTISLGEAVVVSWSVPHAKSVYISGLGTRGRDGQERVVPRSSVRFVLYALTEFGIQTAADSVFVRGTAKSGDEMPKDFSAPRRYRVRAPSFVSLLERIDDRPASGRFRRLLSNLLRPASAIA